MALTVALRSVGRTPLEGIVAGIGAGKPVKRDRLVFDRAYVGYTGALRLVEDIYSVILSDFQ